MEDVSSEGVVLVVDDEPLNVELLDKRLSASGFKVLKADNGKEALKKAREDAPDVILLDVMMPGMDGFEVAERLNNAPDTSMIPIVMLTSLSGMEDKLKGLDAGAVDFLSKPINNEELTARTRSMVRLKKLQELHKVRTGFEIPQDIDVTRTGEGEKARILIVEDDELAVKNYEKMLGAAGYGTITAKDARKALEVLNREIPDLIILDLLLPDISGQELLARIKATSWIKDVSVLVISCVEDMETKIKLIDTGADDYLVKPVNSLEMMARVRASLRKDVVRKELKANLKKVYGKSITDPLTTLYNRQHLGAVIREKIALSERYKRPFSLSILDIDRFKNINDNFGHAVGDDVLKEFSGILKEHVRVTDVVARFGGEEFVIVLTETGIKDALDVSEKLRSAIENYRFAGIGDRTMTVSIGVTEWGENDGKAEDLIKRADEALYDAKNSGRNQVKTRAVADV